MEFADSPDQAMFRQEVRAFIEQNCPAEIRNDPLEGDGLGEEERTEAMARWRAALASRGWIAPHWPKEYGGSSMSIEAQFVLNEELALARAPQVGGTGVGIVGPTIIVHGTDEQKRLHLGGILSGRTQWHQAYSEPGSGSDLASLQTRAIRSGDEYVVNGQKTWQSGAHRSDWAYGLVRTNPDAPKHRGITYLLIDMKTPGITVRPIINLVNEHMFNDVFFEDVHVPVANRLGDEDRGWYVGVTTLDFERSSIGQTSGILQVVQALVDLTKERGRQQEARLHVVDRQIESTVAQLLSLRVFDMQRQGQIPNREASQAKLYTTELRQRVAATGLKAIGLYAQASRADSGVDGTVTRSYLRAVPYTIMGGTSEVQRNIIATRGLGLPRG